MDGWMDEWMDGWVDGWMGGWLAGWLDGWVDGRGGVPQPNSLTMSNLNAIYEKSFCGLLCCLYMLRFDSEVDFF